MAEAARRALSKLAGWSAAAGVLGWAFTECLYTVDGGERAVVWHRFSGGLQPGAKGEGLHFRVPFVEYPKIFDIRLRPRVIATRTGTKDLQTVQISLRVLSRPDEDHLSKIYQDLGEDYDERVLPSIVNEVLKATVVRCSTYVMSPRRWSELPDYSSQERQFAALNVPLRRRLRLRGALSIQADASAAAFVFTCSLSLPAHIRAQPRAADPECRLTSMLSSC